MASLEKKFIGKDSHARGSVFTGCTVSTGTADSSTSMQELVEQSIAFVLAKTTYGYVKTVKNKTLLGLFVTKKGKPKEPMIGWLLNTKISKHTRA